MGKLYENMMMKCTMLYLVRVTWGLILFIMKGTHGFILIYIGDYLITCGFIAYMQIICTSSEICYVELVIHLYNLGFEI